MESRCQPRPPPPAQVFCIFAMLCGTCVFGTLLSELQEVFGAAHRQNREIEDHVDAVSEFLKDNG